MPYGTKWDSKLKKWVVYNKETGRVLGKHSNKPKALRQLAVLHIKVKEK